jgi:hypothetical protein
MVIQMTHSRSYHKYSDGEKLCTVYSFNEVFEEDVIDKDRYVVIDFMDDGNIVSQTILNNLDDYESYYEGVARMQWLDKEDNPVAKAKKEKEERIGLGELRDFTKSINDHVDPDHYKGYIGSKQWIEVMAEIIPDFESAIEMQVRKYLDRNGKKDNSIQELKKAKWYLEYWIAYKINGNQPVRVPDVKHFLDKEV